MHGTKSHKPRTRTLTIEDAPDTDFAYMNIDVSRDPSGNYRLEAVGLSRECAKAAAKYILSTR